MHNLQLELALMRFQQVCVEAGLPYFPWEKLEFSLHEDCRSVLCCLDWSPEPLWQVFELPHAVPMGSDVAALMVSLLCPFGCSDAIH